jgi:hypothetical protein
VFLLWTDAVICIGYNTMIGSSTRMCVEPVVFVNNEMLSHENSLGHIGEKVPMRHLIKISICYRSVFGVLFGTVRQCCGTGSRIRCLFDPWVRGGIESRSGMNIPNIILIT